MADRFFTCETSIGWIGVLISPIGIKACTMPRPTAAQALSELPLGCDAQPVSEEEFGDLAQRLRLYADGEPVVFDDDLDLAGATALQSAVWYATQTIPYGETRSYRWVAEQIGRPQAQRAVGQALGRNPVPIIVPCHRVIRSDGSLGGFGGGLDVKETLLRLEGRNLRAAG